LQASEDKNNHVCDKKSQRKRNGEINREMEIEREKEKKKLKIK